MNEREKQAMLDSEERQALYQQIGTWKRKCERMELTQHEAGLDTVSLKVAQQVEDLFAQHHPGGRTQRLAKAQIIIREAMRANLIGETDWKYPGNVQTAWEPEQ